MKVLCIGHCSYDISSIMDSFPIENMKHSVTNKLENGGGQAANAACLIAKWGVETYMGAALGSDSYAEKIKKEFQMHGVRDNYLETAFDKSTSSAHIIINKQNGSRTVLSIDSDDSSPHMKKTEFDIDANIVLVDGYEYHASMAALNRYQNGITVIDAGKPTNEVLEMCKLCKYIICSQDFAETVSKVKIDFNNPNTLVQVYTKLKERFIKSEIIITLEEHGALYVQDNQIKVMPGIKVEVKDTTAAGDVFHGAFVYGLANNYPIEKCVAYANIAGGLSCSVLGGRVSIPNLNNVVAYYNAKLGVNENGANTNQ